MMERIRKILKGPAGKIIAAIAVIAGIVFMLQGMRGLFGESVEAREARDRVFVCSETMKPFEYTIKLGDNIPVLSPHSGKNTGFPAEFCYWTADGKVKQEPTPVLLNARINKPGATYCPDCQRLVVEFNPPPIQGSPPPPKKGEIQEDRENTILRATGENRGD